MSRLDKKGFVAPPSNWISWGKVGDGFEGKLVQVGEADDSFHPGEKRATYEFEVDEGSYHLSDGTEVKLKNGDLLMVSGKKIINNVMRRCQIGQLVVMEYVGDYKKPGGGGFPAKTIEVKLEEGFKPAPVADEDAPPFI